MYTTSSEENIKYEPIRIHESVSSVVVVLGFYVPPTAKVIRRRVLGLKSLSKDWRSPGSNSQPLVYKASSLTTTPRRLLVSSVYVNNKGA